MVQATRCNVARFYCALKSFSVRIFVTNYWYQRVDVSVHSHISTHMSSRELRVLLYTAIFEKNMRNSTLNYLIPDWSTAVT